MAQRYPRGSKFCEECGTELRLIPIPSSKPEITQEKTEPTPAGEPSQARVPAAKPSRRHVNTVVAGLAIVVLLVCSVFVYRNVSRPVLQFGGPEAIDLVPSPGRVCGSVYLVVNGNGRFVVESISLKLVSLPVSHDSVKVAGSLPTAMDLPSHFSVYVCISSMDIGKGSRLIVDVTGTWVLLGLSERAELHTETDPSWYRCIDSPARDALDRATLKNPTSNTGRTANGQRVQMNWECDDWERDEVDIDEQREGKRGYVSRTEKFWGVVLIVLLFSGVIVTMTVIQSSIPPRPSDYDDMRHECEAEMAEYQSAPEDERAMSPLCQAFYAGKIQFPEEITTPYFPFFNFKALRRSVPFPMLGGFALLFGVIGFILLIGFVCAVLSKSVSH